MKKSEAGYCVNRKSDGGTISPTVKEFPVQSIEACQSSEIRPLDHQLDELSLLYPLGQPGTTIKVSVGILAREVIELRGRCRHLLSQARR